LKVVIYIDRKLSFTDNAIYRGKFYNYSFNSYSLLVHTKKDIGNAMQVFIF